MEREERTDRFTALEDRFSGYEVYDPDGEKIGKVDDLFVDEQDNPEYIGVKMGFLGTSSTLIPWGVVNSTDDEGRRIIVSVDKAKAKDGPAFDDDREITPEFENQVYSYYGLQAAQGSEERGAYGGYYGEEHPGVAMGDTESGEFREHDPAAEGVAEPGGDLDDEDELRVQRSEEELRAGTREREAGALNVRKRVVTERQRVAQPVQAYTRCRITHLYAASQHVGFRVWYRTGAIGRYPPG
jgi:stress response protein YsnF